MTTAELRALSKKRIEDRLESGPAILREREGGGSTGMRTAAFGAESTRRFSTRCLSGRQTRRAEALLNKGMGT